MEIYKIPGKLVGNWNFEVHAMVDTWNDHNVTKDDFEKCILEGCRHAKKNAGIAWIVDTSKASGVFSQEIQNLIESHVFPTFQKIGVKYFITIKSRVDVLTKMTVSTYSAKAGPHGLQLLDVNTVEDGIKWLEANA